MPIVDQERQRLPRIWTILIRMKRWTTFATWSICLRFVPTEKIERYFKNQSNYRHTFLNSIFQVESICQCMFTSEELLKLILIPSLPTGYRSSLVQFLHSVFMTSSTDMAGMDLQSLCHNRNLWQYLSVYLIFSQVHCTVYRVYKSPYLCRANLY